MIYNVMVCVLSLVFSSMLVAQETGATNPSPESEITVKNNKDSGSLPAVIGVGAIGLSCVLPEKISGTVHVGGVVAFETSVRAKLTAGEFTTDEAIIVRPLLSVSRSYIVEKTGLFNRGSTAKNLARGALVTAADTALEKLCDVCRVDEKCDAAYEAVCKRYPWLKTGIEIQGVSVVPGWVLRGARTCAPTAFRFARTFLLHGVAYKLLGGNQGNAQSSTTGQADQKHLVVFTESQSSGGSSIPVDTREMYQKSRTCP